MTLEETGLTPEQVMSVRDRSLEEAYEVHDIGHDMLVKRLKAHNFEVEDHGDDARHADEVFYGDGPDLAVYQDGEIIAYIEIKCKEKEKWFGRCNLRHYEEYVNFSNEVDVPVFIWFALVEDGSSVIHREAFVEVEDTDQINGDVTEITDIEIVFHEADVKNVEDDVMVVDGDDVVSLRNNQVLEDGFPNIHGNDVVELNDDAFRSFSHFLYCVQ